MINPSEATCANDLRLHSIVDLTGFDKKSNLCVAHRMAVATLSYHETLLGNTFWSLCMYLLNYDLPRFSILKRHVWCIERKLREPRLCSVIKTFVK